LSVRETRERTCCAERPALPQLEAERCAIEAEIGDKLEWDAHPENIDKIIKLERLVDFNDRNKWPEYISWLVDKVDKFKKAFGPRVKKINLDEMPAATSGNGMVNSS
jgi:hypothetical protein